MHTRSIDSRYDTAMNSRETRLESPPPRERLLGLVRRILGASAMNRPLPIDARLSELGLSSIKMVSLMLAIETEFDLTIPQSEITPQNFASLASVEALIGKIGDAAATTDRSAAGADAETQSHTSRPLTPGKTLV